MKRNPSEEPGRWTPSASPVAASELSTLLSSNSVVVIHFWAAWNGVDRRFDPEFRPVQDEFAGRVSFRSADVDDPDLEAFCRECGVTNVPALAGFVAGRRVETVVGMRPAAVLRDWIGRLAGDAAAGVPPFP